jgi:glutathione S-transferase
MVPRLYGKQKESDMPSITLYHAPDTRSFRALWFLEELGTPYELKRVKLEQAEQKAPEFLALNPMGKLPTVVIDGHAVWESPAIIAHHLGDLFPETGLAPAPGTAARADFYRWLFFGTAVMEPALLDRMKGHEVNASKRAGATSPR